MEADGLAKSSLSSDFGCGSNVTYDDSMNSPNIVWLAPLPSNSTKAWAAPGVLVALDARPDGIIYRYLITEYVNTQGLHAKMILGKLQLMSTTWMCRMRNQRSRFSFAVALFKHYTISFPWSSSFHRDSASEACKKLFWYISENKIRVYGRDCFGFFRKQIARHATRLCCCWCTTILKQSFQ
ncbi:hypothetical protein TB2_010110 [Malus domestica]